MKTNKLLKQQKQIKLFDRRFLGSLILPGLVIGSLISQVALAQDPFWNDRESVLDSEQIDIDGQYRKKPSQADKINKMRKKLEQQNEELVQKKIENIRIKEEHKLSQKLRNAFSGNELEEGLDSDMPSRRHVVAHAPITVEEKNSKVTTSGGIQHYQTENIGLDSKVSLGVNVESMVTDRVSLGLGFSYTSMDITNIPSNFYYYNNSYYYPYSYGGYNNLNGYGNTYANGFNETINYRNVGIELNSKFFILAHTKVRPYIGAGLGYNRTSLERDQSQNQNTSQYGGINNGSNLQNNGKVSVSNISASLLVGSEVAFGTSWGINVEVKYTRNLTSNFGDSLTQQYQNNPGDYSLRSIGSEIEDADVLALNAGILFRF